MSTWRIRTCVMLATAMLVAVAASSMPLLAEETSTTPATTTSAEPPHPIMGEVVDPSSYLRNGHRGADISEQTYAAVDGGQTLAILEDGTNNLYVLLAEQAGEDPNELAYDYVNQEVKAVGKVYERGGLRGLVATSIEPAVPPAPGPAPKDGPPVR